ncbi:MAG: hypothetical protein JSV82_09495 [Planctomycetota bacterium]|nr:MAG: hypothetical protein JSV82_09495 [Planctomycetota bacterium]
MGAKGSNFFEEHVEKIILAVVVLVCVWLTLTRVFISPVRIKYDNRTFSPGNIDIYIKNQAEDLEVKLNRKPETIKSYKPRIDEFVARLDSAINNIDVSIVWPVPPYLEKVEVKGIYSIPEIGEISDVEVEHIRAVAYVPTVTVDEENVYSGENSEPNDIDFVSVEAKFDVDELYKRFNENFAGHNIREEWRDPCLAKPVFAAVELQRQEHLSDGSWSDWQPVPRAKIERRKKMFDIIEGIEDLPAGGLEVRLLQFDDGTVRKELLQPEVYRIASAKEDWFPPRLHKKYTEYQKQIDLQEKREAQKAAKKEEERKDERSGRVGRARGREGGLGGLFSPMGPMGPSPGGSPGGMPSGMPTRKKGPTRRSRERKVEKERPEKPKKETKDTSEIYREFSEIQISEREGISKMEKPLLFWAHDDAVEPEKSYRYRIRLGVFNPIAGTNQFKDQDKVLKDKVILWSEFSDVTEVVNIPGRLYFFPCDIQEATEAVTVQVSKYVLGYWYSKDFTVRQGEVIGKVIDYEPTEEEEEANVRVPSKIDYATGAVLVDVVPVNDWSGEKNLRARHYFDMLYSFDGADMERVPIKSRYWADGLQAKFNEIKRLEKEPKEPLRGWGGRLEERRLGPRPLEETPPGMPPGLWPPMFPPALSPR